MVHYCLISISLLVWYLQVREVDCDPFLQMSRVWVCDYDRHYLWDELELICRGFYSIDREIDWAVFKQTFQTGVLEQGCRGKSCLTMYTIRRSERGYCLYHCSIHYLSNKFTLNQTISFYSITTITVCIKILNTFIYFLYPLVFFSLFE